MIKHVIFTKKALEYDMGKSNYEFFSDQDNITVHVGTTFKKILGDISTFDLYHQGKEVLIFDIRRGSIFQSCKPSAHYQIPFVSGCIGMCEYCYLNTQLTNKPYTKIYVNTDEILNKAEQYINERNKLTLFEAAATSDPICVEKYSNTLKKAILYFADEPLGKLRFVTKYTDVDSLLSLNHNNKTEIRFSINTDYVIKTYEHRTASIDKRLEAAKKVMESNYPSGFLIAPIIVYDNYLDDYGKLIDRLATIIPQNYPHKVTFELITHRFTTKAKNHIMQIYPQTTLPMNEEERRFKYGQFGYGKYIYQKETMDEIKKFFKDKISALPFEHEIKYLV